MSIDNTLNKLIAIQPKTRWIYQVWKISSSTKPSPAKHNPMQISIMVYTNSCIRRYEYADADSIIHVSWLFSATKLKLCSTTTTYSNTTNAWPHSVSTSTKHGYQPPPHFLIAFKIFIRKILFHLARVDWSRSDH